MIITGTFTSVWKNYGLIETPATLNTSNGELDIESLEMDVEDDCLEHEYFTDIDGNVYDVCPNCRAYILETVMLPSIGKELKECKICQNCNC